MKVVFVYRGENPFLRQLAEGLGDGYETERREISVETPWEVYSEPVKLSEMTGALDGVIVTDNTLDDTVEKLIGRRPINAYNALEWKILGKTDVVVKLKPIVDEIRSKGRVPVVLRNCLGHHLYDEMHLPAEEKQGLDVLIRTFSYRENNEGEIIQKAVQAGNYYSLILQREFDMPVVTREAFCIEEGKIENIGDILSTLGISKEEAVLLVDHHVYKLRDKKLEQSGLAEVDIVPICPCCVGLKSSKDLREYGFKVFPLEYSEERKGAIQNLQRMIVGW